MMIYYTSTEPITVTDELLLEIAQHEAGHAVMQWLRGYPATELTVGRDGGLCAGTGRPIRPEDNLLIALGGIAVDSGYGFCKVDLEHSELDDLDQARRELRSRSWLRLVGDGASPVVLTETVEDALARYFRRACDLLFPEMELVEFMGFRLFQAGRLSARSVAALCREHSRRQGQTHQ
jgi:hypothetical protein